MPYEIIPLNTSRCLYFWNLCWRQQKRKENGKMSETFLESLKSNSRHVLRYENASLKAKAKSCIPLSELLSSAKSKCDSNDTKILRDALLLELLDWFKSKFFTWFNAGHCTICNQTMQNMGHVVPSVEDVRYGANRVESYKCERCGATERFPRYNDPGTLKWQVLITNGFVF